MMSRFLARPHRALQPIVVPRAALQPRGRRFTPTQAGIVARWCIDIRYGVKLDAVQLMQEWVRDVGSRAGLSAANARIHSGAVGVPESRLELEVEFASFAELEDFWASIPPEEHRAWSQRMQGLIVHGSPTWEVYRTVPVEIEGVASSAASSRAAVRGPGIAAAAASSSSSSVGSSRAGQRRSVPGGAGLLAEPSEDDLRELALPQDDMPAVTQTTDSGLAVVSGDEAAEVVARDWKGDPMKINPGDKLPFRFL